MTDLGPSNRSKDWLAGLSVGDRLLLGFSFTAALFVVALLTALWTSQRSQTALQQLVFVDARLASLWADVGSAINRTRLRETQFLLRHRELGFGEARNRYVTLVMANLTDAHAGLTEIRVVASRSTTHGSDSTLLQNTRVVESSLNVYEKEFLAAVMTIGTIGSLDSGLIGTMRAEAQRMEAVIKRHGDAKMLSSLLQVRRKEKDTELRSVESEGPELVAAIMALRRELTVARMPEAARNELFEMLKRYEAGTGDYFVNVAAFKRHQANFQVAATSLEAPQFQMRQMAVENELATANAAENAIRLGMLLITISGLGAAVLTFKISTLTIRDVTHVHAELTLAKKLAESSAQLKEELREMEVTFRRATEVALSVSNHELDTFSYSVSHELRSPLNTINGFSMMLAKKLSGRDDAIALHYLERIRTGTAQMARLIENLLTLAQVVRSPFKQDLVNLSELAQSICENLKASQPDRQIVIQIEPGLQVQGDARLLRIMLENLLGNAWKYSLKKASGQIRFGQQLDVDGNSVFLVQDKGIGFDMAYADKLFKPFERLHEVSESSLSSGIGLATASRIVLRHSGRIWAESKPGQGATFFFTLGSMPPPFLTIDIL